MFGLKLIDKASRDLHRLWTVRISLAYGVFAGISTVMAAFIDVLNPWFLVVISVLVNVALIPLAPLVKQADPEAGQ